MLNHVGRKREATRLVSWKWTWEEELVAGSVWFFKGCSWSFSWLPAFTPLLLFQPKYSCICDAGWKTPSNSMACTLDVNECDLWPAPCSEGVQCFNTPGSFYCGACPTGTWVCPLLGSGARLPMPVKQDGRTNFLSLPRDKKAVFRMPSNPVSYPISLDPTPDHLLQQFNERNGWFVPKSGRVKWQGQD